jgi:hypothetical protein
MSFFLSTGRGPSRPPRFYSDGFTCTNIGGPAAATIMSRILYSEPTQFLWLDLIRIFKITSHGEDVQSIEARLSGIVK